MAHRRFITAVGSGLLVLLLAAGMAHAAGPYAYITHHNHGKVTVIDTATDIVSATVSDGVTCPSGLFGPYGIAITPAPLVPTSKEDCKNGGYRRFGPPAGPFRNQGQCISYVQNRSGGRS